MDGINPLLTVIFGGGMASVVITLVTLFSSRKLQRANTESRIVESTNDLNDRLITEAVAANTERDSLRKQIRLRDTLNEDHDGWDRGMISQARD
ncbi:MAG: hypothetical protein ABIP03_04780, partial [Aquihabitans sp.]